MKCRILIFMITVIALAARAQGPMSVSETKYDWSELAAKIVGDKTAKRDQAYAIYRWLCDNIAYDTSYSIHDADTAIEQKRGVCQAYCEIFYRLAEPLGLEAHIISGFSKDSDGIIGARGHAWLFVYTNGNKGILVDPTWGAGSVNNGQFKRKKGDDSWFHVDPAWMIFTHYPEDSSYQLLDAPVDYETFLRLKPLWPSLADFGYDADDLFAKSVSGQKLDIPDCYNKQEIKVDNMPRQGTLRVGKLYDFSLSDKGKYEFAIINEDDYGKEWHSSGCRHRTSFIPSSGGGLSISYRVKGTSGRWTTLVDYKVAQPTGADIAALEKAAPHKSPVFKSLENFYPQILRSKGVDFASLLTQVKNEGIRKLPQISSDGNFALNAVPMNGDLQAGRSYTFKFSPYEAGDWVIINGEQWLRAWTQDSDSGAWVMTVQAAPSGTLRLGYKAPDSPGTSYDVFMVYDIK